jgi:hypothetical protein
VLPGDDPSTLLLPGGDLERLRLKVAANLSDLNSLHVEETIKADVDQRLSYNVSYKGRCSGLIGFQGSTYRFVTTSDERMLLAAAHGGNGKWVEAPMFVLPRYCVGGPIDVALNTTPGSGEQSLLYDAKRIGVETVSGQKAVHFRQKAGSLTEDSWITADGLKTRVLKIVRTNSNGNVITMLFSQFDSAPAIAPEPPADKVIPYGSN